MLAAILSLRLISEVHRKFAQPLHGVYVDLKAAFDSLDRVKGHARYIGTPLKIINLLQALHYDTSSRVRDGNKLSLPFVSSTWVRQGSVHAVNAPKLFFTTIDWIMNNMPSELGVVVGGHCFDDVDYATTPSTLLVVDSITSESYLS